MNIGNHTKVVSASSLLTVVITPENAQEYESRVQIELLLLQHGLGFETDHSKKILVEQVIALLQRKQVEIESILNGKITLE